jgi:hypothetical protein
MATYLETVGTSTGTSTAAAETPSGVIAQTLASVSQALTGTWDAETKTGVITQSLSRASYATTGKNVEGEWPNYESYDKAEMWSTTSTKLTFATFMRWQNEPLNFYSTIFSNGYIGVQGQAWWDSRKEFGIWLRDSDNSGLWEDSLGGVTHGIDIGDWFALMFSVDYSGANSIFNIWTHKLGDSAASNIFLTLYTDNAGPRNLATDDSGGSIAALASHPYYSTSSSNIDFSEFFITDEFVDWGDPTVRAKFVDSSGRPVGLGADGSGLTGTAAKIYLPDGNGAGNKGTAGNFTEVGTISDSWT